MTSPTVKKIDEQFAALSVNSNAESSQEAMKLAQKVSDLLLRPDEKVMRKLKKFPEEVQPQIQAVHKEAKKLLFDMATTTLTVQTEEMVKNAKTGALIRATADALMGTVCKNNPLLIERLKDLTAVQKIDVLTVAAPLMAECRSVKGQDKVLKIVMAIDDDARDQSLQHYPTILRSFTDDAIQLHFLESLVSIMPKGMLGELVVEGLGNVAIQTPHICWGKYTFSYEANPVSWLKSLQTAIPFLQNRRFCEEYHVKEIVRIVNQVAYSDDAKVHAAGLMEYATYASDAKDILQFLEGVPVQARAITVQNCKRVLAPIIEPAGNINKAIEVVKSPVAEEYLSLVDFMPKDSPHSVINSLKTTLESSTIQRRKEVRDVLALKLQSGMHVNDFENYCETIKRDLLYKREISDTALLEERYLTNFLCMGLTPEQQKDMQESVASIRFAVRLEVLRNTMFLTTAAASFKQKMLVLAAFANICSKTINLQELLEDFFPLVNPKNLDSYPNILIKLGTLTRDQRKEFVANFLANHIVSEVVPDKKKTDPFLHV